MFFKRIACSPPSWCSRCRWNTAASSRASCRRNAGRRRRRVLLPARLHLRRTHVHGLGGRFPLHLRLARAGHDFLLRARRLHAPPARLAGGRREVPHPRRAQHRLPRLRHHLDLRHHRRDEPRGDRRQAPDAHRLRDAAALRHHARARRPRLQGRRRAVPDLGARCLPRRADADHRLPLRRLEGRRLHRPHARARSLPRDARAGAEDHRRHRHSRRALAALRQPRRDAAG